MIQSKTNQPAFFKKKQHRYRRWYKDANDSFRSGGLRFGNPQITLCRIQKSGHPEKKRNNPPQIAAGTL
jgi:hypothetical protein